MQAASLFDGFSFDLFPPFENGLTASEVDVSRRQVVQALVVSTVVVVLDDVHVRARVRYGDLLGLLHCRAPPSGHTPPFRQAARSCPRPGVLPQSPTAAA